MFHKIFMLILIALNIHPPALKCRLNSKVHFGEPLPIILRNGKLLEPTDRDGNVDLNHEDNLTLSCDGVGYIYHPHTVRNESIATVSCDSDSRFTSEGWLSEPASFYNFRCSNYPNHNTQRTNRTCYNSFPVYEVGYKVEDHFYPVYESCFNDRELNAVYSKYDQKGYNFNFQPGVDRPFFIDTNVYGHVPVESLFMSRGLRSAVSQQVGSRINTYFTNKEFLNRGHLAAKTDFVFAFGQRASFHYVNCAPQWYNFNGGNWNTLEVDLRRHIHDLNADAIIYTGTFEVTQLRNEYDQQVSIYLSSDENNNAVIPVPKYYYKVVYVPATKKGTAFVGINNPYFSPREINESVFCDDKCRGGVNYRWLTWNPNSFSEGYSFCCTISDFKRVVPHLPEFEVDGMLP